MNVCVWGGDSRTGWNESGENAGGCSSVSVKVDGKNGIEGGKVPPGGGGPWGSEPRVNSAGFVAEGTGPPPSL